MATKNFTQFSINTSLTSSDYLVGYYGNGSEEFKLPISGLESYLEPTRTITTNTEFSGTNSTALTAVEELHLHIPPYTKYAITGQLLLKEVGASAPGIDCRVTIDTATTPTGTISIHGNHNRYDLVDLPVGVIIPTDTPVTNRAQILQLDATSYNFFSLPVSFVVNNASNLECTIKHSFAQTTQAANSTFILGLGTYLIGHPIDGN
jgi:hypothetical protein